MQNASSGIFLIKYRNALITLSNFALSICIEQKVPLSTNSALVQISGTSEVSASRVVCFFGAARAGACWRVLVLVCSLAHSSPPPATPLIPFPSPRPSFPPASHPPAAASSSRPRRPRRPVARRSMPLSNTSAGAPPVSAMTESAALAPSPDPRPG